MLIIYRYVDGVEIRCFLVVHLYGGGQRDTVSKADGEVGAFCSDFVFAIHTSLFGLKEVFLCLKMRFLQIL